MLRTKRELGFFDAVMMGLGGAIGFEIFALLDYPYFGLGLGGSVVFALLLAGLANLLIMMNYCELSTAIPEVGGAYTYIKKAYGGFVPFVFGCFRWLASIFGAALAAIVFTDQLSYLMRVTLDLSLLSETQTPFVAVLVVIIMAILGVRGKKGVGTSIVFAFIVIFSVFIVSGILLKSPEAGLLPQDSYTSVMRIFAATVYMFPMFFGVRSLVAGAAHIKNPDRNLPRAIILSSLLIIPLYIGIAYVASGLVPLESLQLNGNTTEAGNQPIRLLNLAAETILGWPGGALVSLAGMVASLSALGTSLAVQASVLRGMSRDAYLPRRLLSLRRYSKTPYVAIIAGSIFVLALTSTAFFADINTTLQFLGYAGSFGSLLVFAFVNLSLMKLRREKPYMNRPFKTPAYPLTPVASIFLSVVLLLSTFLLGEAVIAIITCLGLTSLVLLTYYLRMIGRFRLQVAAGGAGVGVGASLVVASILIGYGLMPVVSQGVHIYLLAAGVVTLATGILNVTADRHES